MAKKSNNGGGRNNKKFIKQQQTKRNNYFNLPIIIDESASKEVEDEIIDVLTRVPFDKISVPVNIYRKFIDKEAAEQNSNKVITTGFVKRFDEDKCSLTVIVFNPVNAQIIDSMVSPAIEIVFSEYPEKGTFGTITKLNITDAGIAEYEEVEESVPEEATYVPADEEVAEPVQYEEEQYTEAAPEEGVEF